MSHFLGIICILIISVIKQLVYGSSHALVGNYSELNPKDCGITQFVHNLDYGYFKGHKNTIARMIGRNASEDEVPWIVYIEARVLNTVVNRCTGVLIDDQWVLTAAHCLPGYSLQLYYIYLGIHSLKDPTDTYLVRASQIIKHPDFKLYGNRTILPVNDLGLIKLDRTISSIKPNNGSEQFRSICLPKKNVFNNKKELAMFAGWGNVSREEGVLQVGIRLLYPSDDYSSPYSRYYMATFSMDNHTLLCKGDSGGPLWQYDSGRAVLIGIATFGKIDKVTSCAPPLPEAIMWFSRVSKYIDWIKSVTQLN